MSVIVVIGILMIGFCVLNFLYKRTNHYKNIKNNVQKFIDGVPNEIEIASFGSSYAKYGILPEKFPCKTFNFGIQPESLSYDFKMLKMYTTNLKEKAIVILNVPNLVFSFVDYASDASNTKYYYFLDKQYIKDYKPYKYFTKITMPLIEDPFLARFILRDVRKEDYITRTQTKLVPQQVHKEAMLRIEGWKKQANIMDVNTCTISEEMQKTFLKTTQILKDMIQYCIEHKFRPVIVIPPVSKILSDLLPKEFMKIYLYDNIEIANERKIPVLDYLYSPQMQDYQLYINSDFLNLQGREKLTNKIMEDLKKIGYVK